MERKQHALKKIDVKKGQGLELGPLYAPVVLKSEADIYYADHMSAKDLRKKYEGHPIPLQDIVPVDYVLSTGLLDALNGKKFDYVIASHVIEHIPDVAGWLREIASILEPGGILSLVVPDKRYSFDVSRATTQPAQIMGAYLDKLQKSTSAMIYESAAEYRDFTPVDLWSGKVTGPFEDPKDESLDEAMRKARLNKKPEEYVDAHCYVFDPAALFAIFRRLIRHGIFDFEVVYFCDTNPNELEFYVSLRKKPGHMTKEEQLKSIPDVPEPPSVADLQKEIAFLHSEIARILNSRSMLITKPLRHVSQVVKKRRKQSS